MSVVSSLHKKLILIGSIAIVSLTGCSTFNGLGSYKGPRGRYKASGDKFRGHPYNRIDRSRIKSQLPRTGFTLIWPTQGAKFSRGFSDKGRRSHDGIDLAGKKRDAIIASHEGLVVYAGAGYRGYGKMIILEYDEQWGTLYGHLNKILVKEGQYVNQGDLIGLMGNTGRSSGDHLHFELLRDKEPIDPMPFLKYQLNPKQNQI